MRQREGIAKVKVVSVSTNLALGKSAALAGRCKDAARFRGRFAAEDCRKDYFTKKRGELDPPACSPVSSCSFSLLSARDVVSE